MKRSIVLAAFLVGVVLQGAPDVPILTWGDQGNGRYRNPILNADYSDPDVIRVGADFFLIASDFHFVGMQVLESQDLVNWRLIGQVFHRLPMDVRYDEMRGYAQGTWAPSLRFHRGTYYLYVCTPHDGLFLWRATNPAGPWSGPVTVRAVDGWEDPCPFWDDDGSAYLVHGRVGAGPLMLHRMTADGTRLLDTGVEIYRGPVAEGPKLFKRHGWYYISLPEGGVEKGGQTMLRSRALYGPYDRRPVLPDGSPHQGGIVELDDGTAWFIGFRSAGHLGRVCHLLPVQWGNDDWPVFGKAGQPMVEATKPHLPVGPVVRPQTDDDFDSPILAPQWQWNHNPVDSAWSLTARPGWLRLQGLPAAALKTARNSVTQKLWGGSGQFEAKLDVSGLSDGQRAGFAFMSGYLFGWIGAVREGGKTRLATDDTVGPELNQSTLWLRGTYDGAVGRRAFSLDGKSYQELGEDVPLRFSQWKGSRVALFCYGSGGGHVDIDEVHYACRDRQAGR